MVQYLLNSSPFQYVHVTVLYKNTPSITVQCIMIIWPLVTLCTGENKIRKIKATLTTQEQARKQTYFPTMHSKSQRD